MKMTNKENKNTDKELDAETEKELMKMVHSPIKGLMIIIAVIISALCFFVFDLRKIGILIIILISVIGYYSSKKDLERYNEIMRERDRKDN